MTNTSDIWRERSPGKRRWIVPAVLGVSLYIAFIDRMNLSLAMPQLSAHFGWSTDEVGSKGGLLLGSFYIAYGLSNLFLSGIAARRGARRSLIGLVICFSVFTMLGAPLGASLGLFIATRICLGLGEGVHFPMMNVVTKQWFPVFERSRANTIWVFGSTLAMITMPMLLVPVIEHFGWQTMLVACGALGMLVTIPLIYWFVYDSPRESPWVSSAEADYIARNIGDIDTPEAADRGFARSPAFLLAVSGAVLNNYCIYGVMNWLPTYFVEARGMDFSSLSYAAALPYVAGVASFVLYGYLGDRTNRRILLAGCGFLGTAVCLMVALNATSLVLVVAAFSSATFFQTAYITQEFAIVQRLLPAAVIGKAAGVYNGISVLCGAVGGTVLLGQIVALTGSYDAGFYSVVAATLLGGAVMVRLSRMVKY